MEKNRRNIKLRLKDIIDELDPELLKAFVVQYATNDKSFEMAIKAHFISNVKDVADDREKYRRLLDEMIKPKNAYNKITASQKKMLGIIFKDLVLQLNDLLSTDTYTEAYFLAKECLDKMAYLQNRYYVKDTTIESCRVQMLHGLELILDEELAPAFRKSMEDELKELVHRSYFIPADFNLMEVLNTKNVLVKSDKKELIDSLKSKISKKERDLSILKTILQLSCPFPELATDVLMTFGHDKLFVAVRSLIGDGKFDVVDFYIDNPKVEFKYNKEVLNILKHIERDAHEDLNKALLAFPVEDYSIIDIKMVCEALTDIYIRKEADKIMDWLQALPFNLKSRLFERANKNEALLQMLADKNDIEWLKVHDRVLIERGYEKEVQQLYFDIVEDFIADHIGKKSREYLQRTQSHLMRIGQERVAERLVDRISKQFDHRISIK